MAKPWIEHWTPEDERFWRSTGSSVARRNLIFSIFAEFLGFSVWMLWSVTATQLGAAGFDFSDSQLFTLVSVPALVGATARFPYTLAVPRFGGRNWTVVSALLLLVPTVLLALLVSNPGSPYWAFLLGGAAAGLGGGNFASSMANISFFYPERRKGLALGLNAAGGNVGVAFVQLVVPVMVGVGFLGAGAGVVGPLLGGAQGPDGALALQNAWLMFVPPILASALCAWLFMDNLSTSRSALREQVVVAKRRHTWVMSWLYVGTFGSFIGYSAALPLLIKTQFPGVEYGVGLAFLGPLVGSLVRPLGGWMSDRWSGTRITFAVFALMILAVLGVVACLDSRGEPWAFPAFLGTFTVLFVLAGVGNGSTFRMIPVIFRLEALRGVAPDDAEARERALARGRREAAAALGFCSAIGAYGGWLIPQGYGLSSAATGGPQGALLAFIGFYVSCLGLTWWHYMRRTSERAERGCAPSLAEARA